MADWLRQLLTELSDEDFERLYGPVARSRPVDAARLLEGLDAPWWIVGGWAIEAFSGVSRAHEDLDVGLLAGDAPALFELFLGTHHVWLAGSGMLCPVLSPDQRMPSWTNQIWVREHSGAPWLLDVIVAPERAGRWVFRRDPDVVEDLDRVTWRADDGIVYQKPEVTLAFKAALARPKDDADLEAALPRLDAAAVGWLADTVARLHPGHQWLQRLR